MICDPENMGLDPLYANVCNIGRDVLQSTFFNNGGINLHNNYTWGILLI